MNQQEAIQDMEILKASIVVYKQEIMKGVDTMEKGDGETTMGVLAEAFPWVFGDRDLEKGLDIILGNVEKSGEITPMEHYNMLTVLTMFTPEILPVFNSGRADFGRDPITQPPRIPVMVWDPPETP